MFSVLLGSGSGSNKSRPVGENKTIKRKRLTERNYWGSDRFSVASWISVGRLDNQLHSEVYATDGQMYKEIDHWIALEIGVNLRQTGRMEHPFGFRLGGMPQPTNRRFWRPYDTVQCNVSGSQLGGWQNLDLC